MLCAFSGNSPPETALLSIYLWGKPRTPSESQRHVAFRNFYYYKRTVPWWPRRGAGLSPTSISPTAPILGGYFRKMHIIYIYIYIKY